MIIFAQVFVSGIDVVVPEEYIVNIPKNPIDVTRKKTSRNFDISKKMDDVIEIIDESDIEIVSENPNDSESEVLFLERQEESESEVSVIKSSVDGLSNYSRDRKRQRRRLGSFMPEENVQVVGSSRTEPLLSRRTFVKKFPKRNRTRPLTDIPSVSIIRTVHRSQTNTDNIDVDEAMARRLQEEEYSAMRFSENHSRMQQVLGSHIELQGTQIPIHNFFALQNRIANRGNYIQDD
jgi:hypothetical protein